MSVEDLYQLSPVQEGMLFHALQDREAAPYFEQFVFRYRRNLDSERLANAWRKVVERHAVLRTAFFWEEVEAPVQVVHRKVDLPFVREDWTSLTAAESEKRLEAFLADDRARGFELDRAPLLRLTAIRWPDESYRLVWSYHHLLLDAWSANLLLEEVATIYAASEDPALADRRPFRDYIQWLRQQGLETAEAYWRRTFSGLSTAPALGIDRTPGSPTPGRQHAEIELDLPVELSAAIESLARRHRLTLHSVIEGAWAFALSRFSGTEDVVFGSTLSGRPPALPQADTMIGCFITTLPVRVRVAPERELVSWLAELQRDLIELQRHQHSPLVEIRRWIGCPANRPLFETLLVFESLGRKTPESQNGSRNWSGRQRTNYPLTLVVWPERTIKLQARFYQERLAKESVSRLLSYIETLLGAFAGTPVAGDALRLQDLPPLAPAEQQKLSSWNKVSPSEPPPLCLHEVFAAQAAKTPEALALSWEGGEMTYRELELRSARVAAFLVRCGVGPEVPVALMFERGPDIVVALIAVLKAGGAYVPIDPAYPRERQQFLLSDSGAAVLLCDRRLAVDLPASAARVVFLDEVPETALDQLPCAATPANLAYVIYTSGSTGQPKGVLVRHENVMRLFTSTDGWFRFGPRDVWTLFHSYAFDFSVWEIWGALLYGGRLVLVPYWVSRSPEDFRALIERQGVTVLNQTPSAFRQLAAADLSRADDLALRLVIFGGEALDPQILRPWLERHGDERPRLVNMYGITETTVHVTYRRIVAQDLATAGSPIGGAIPDLGLCVVDRRLQAVPIGVAGELCISGAGLARGYLNRPELTAARFVPDSWGQGQGARLYRSGDLARYRSDGELEHLGRIDHQVKIRGFRIELGEIESVLTAHPDVREAVVEARPDESGDRRLVAYVVPASPGISIAALREHVRARQPEPMVPAAFMLLDRLPLTPHGKVDRKALPAPEPAAAAGIYMAPRTPEEVKLAGIWADLLKLERVGVEDDFFALGGDSIKAIRLISRINERLASTLGIADVFQFPTIASLASAILLRRPTPAAASQPLRRGERPLVLPLSFAQERLWFLDQLQPDSPAYNIPSALSLRGRLSWPALAASFNALAARHEALRTSFDQIDGQPVQVIATTLNLAPPLIDLSGLSPGTGQREARNLAQQETARPFDLAQGPLARATLLRLAEDHHVALFTLHHIISDGWSMGVLVRELGTFYAALARGERPTLPELPIQYADYALWQREWLSGPVLAEQIGYWRQRLAGAPSVLELPVDRPRPPVQRFRGARRTVHLAGDVQRALAGVQGAQGVTLFMILLAAFQALLVRITGQEDVVVGSPVAGRSRIETEGLIGFFVNTVVLRGELHGDPVFGGILAAARDSAVAAYAHTDLPFEKLVEELQPERSLAHAPVFQVALALQNVPRATLQLPGLTLEAIDTEAVSTKFDLTLGWHETPEKLLGVWEYDSDLFDASTIHRLQGYFETLLRGALAAPESRLSALPLLSAAEHQQIIQEWNDSAVPRAAGTLLHELVAAQAQRTPDAPAVRFEGGVLSYRELDRRAGRLASRLRRLGVEPDKVVGVLMERSVEMAVALLGILRAGGAYLPLDPGQPRKRLAWVLADAGVVALVAQQRLLNAMPRPAFPVVCLEEGWDGEGEPEAAPVVLPDEALAYVIYTSGSTGWPKGVMIAHRGIVNRMLWMQEAHGMIASDRLLQKTPYTFDVSVWEIFWPLTTGACLVMARPGGHRDGAYLNQVAARERVTVMHFVPSMLNAFLEEPDLSGCLGLRLLVCSGEALSPELLRRCRERLPARLENLYGPTEASVEVTAWNCQAAAGSGVPIGRPVPNTRVLLLDLGGHRAPAGVAGELCIGGIQIARGYWNRPDLTAERFVPDPYGAPGQRLYRTGDLARYRTDGAIEYLGRIDHQVKIRGIRIELGEIESVLGGHPDVGAAVVAASSKGTGDRRLVAYVVPANGTTPEPAALRDHLRAHLPEYMVPTDWVSLAAFPLTSSGKIDRRALPDPDRPEPRAVFVAPRSGLERTIAAIWQDVLGLERVGVYDNFFDLGGHSLLMMRVKSRVLEHFGVQVSMIDLLSHANVGALARFLTADEMPSSMRPREEEQIERQTERSEEGKARLRRLRRSVRPATAVGESR